MNDFQHYFEDMPLVALLLRDGAVVRLTKMAARLFGGRFSDKPLSDFLPPYETSQILTSAAQNQSLTLPGVPVADGFYDVQSVCSGPEVWLVLFPHQKTGELTTALSLSAFTALGQEIRAPLIPMISAVSLLSKRLAPIRDEKNQRYFSFLSQNCFRLLRLSNNLTELPQYASGDMSLYPCERDIGAFAAELLDSASPFADVRELSLRFEGSDAPLLLLFDEQKIERLLYNLLSNAIKNTPSGGSIALSVSSDATFAYLRVSDTGCGIPPEKLLSLFHTHASHHAEDGAFGLGLSLVRMIAELHGGAVILESRQGEGNMVTVSLRRGKGDLIPLRSHPAADYTGEFPHALVELSDSIPGGHPLYDMNYGSD